MRRPAAQSRTTDTAAWATTSPFWARVVCRPVERLAPRSASMGSACAASHAGATPKSRPVSRDVAKAKALLTAGGYADGFEVTLDHYSRAPGSPIISIRIPTHRRSTPTPTIQTVQG